MNSNDWYVDTNCDFEIEKGFIDRFLDWFNPKAPWFIGITVVVIWMYLFCN